MTPERLAWIDDCVASGKRPSLMAARQMLTFIREQQETLDEIWDILGHYPTEADVEHARSLAC